MCVYNPHLSGTGSATTQNHQAEWGSSQKTSIMIFNKASLGEHKLTYWLVIWPQPHEKVKHHVEASSHLVRFPFRYGSAVNIESQWQGAGDYVFKNENEEVILSSLDGTCSKLHLWQKHLAHVFHRTKLCTVPDVHVYMLYLYNLYISKWSNGFKL